MENKITQTEMETIIFNHGFRKVFDIEQNWYYSRGNDDIKLIDINTEDVTVIIVIDKYNFSKMIKCNDYMLNYYIKRFVHLSETNIIDDLEKLTDRYIEAEDFIYNLNWLERIFINRKITKFVKSRSSKYDF